jgi:hypothetical protein
MPGLPGRVQRSRPGCKAPPERDGIDQVEHFAKTSARSVRPLANGK